MGDLQDGHSVMPTSWWRWLQSAQTTWCPHGRKTTETSSSKHMAHSCSRCTESIANPGGGMNIATLWSLLLVISSTCCLRFLMLACSHSWSFCAFSNSLLDFALADVSTSSSAVLSELTCFVTASSIFTASWHLFCSVNSKRSWTIFTKNILTNKNFL